MAEIVWTEPALQDLDRIADYIALDDPGAARKLVRAVYESVAHLAKFPQAGSYPAELRGGRYRQLVIPPCRVFYRHAENTAFIVHVMRSEQKLRATRLRGKL